MNSIGLAQLLRRIRELCHDIDRTSIEILRLPPECDSVLSLIHNRAQRISNTTTK